MFLLDYRVTVVMRHETKHLELRASDAVQCVKDVRAVYDDCGPIKVTIEPSDNPSLVVGKIERRPKSFIHRCI